MKTWHVEWHRTERGYFTVKAKDRDLAEAVAQDWIDNGEVEAARTDFEMDVHP